MSIWSSLRQTRAFDLGYQPGETPDVEIDVATATSWNQCVRIAMTGTDHCQDAAMLNTEQVHELVDALTSALAYIESRQ